jgi:hypothetical protein
MLKFRPHMIGEIMTDPKGKDEVLSVGAKTTITKMAKEFVYGFDEKITNKYMTKGLEMEDKSIELLNSVLFTSYKKNEETLENDWLRGTPDLICKDSVIDIKTSWSLATFPCLSELGKDKGYEWQGRAYMMLTNLDKFEICYCLVSTPENLIGYEDKTLHLVDHINPELRITRVLYERDKTLENKIKLKVEAAREYYQEVINQISAEHIF